MTDPSVAITTIGTIITYIFLMVMMVTYFERLEARDRIHDVERN